MSYELNIPLTLGLANIGITDMRAQLVDSLGVDSGTAISAGFVEIGSGHYLWNYASFSDGFRGGVKFYKNSAPSALLGFTAINPEEAEYTDAKTSTRLASGSYTATDNAGISAIKAKTDNLPADPAGQSAILAAITSAIGGLNDLSSSDVQAAAAAALTAYDPPTDAELDAAIGTIAALVWSHATRTLTASGGVTAADVWDYLTADADTPGSMGKLLVDKIDAKISQIAATVTANNPTGYANGNITIQRGVTVDRQLTDVSIIPADAERAVLTVKNNLGADDSEALLQIDSDDGLTILNGVAVEDGSAATITFDSDAETVDFHINDDVTANLPISMGSGYYYDVKFFYPTSASVATAVMRFSVVSVATKEV